MQRLLLPAILFFCFSVVVLIFNILIYQFPGINYLQHNFESILIFLFINIVLLFRILGIQIITKKIIQEYLLFILVSVLIVFGANAIQYTPFNPIDASILALEKKLHIDSLASIIWTHQHPEIYQYLQHIYNLLTLEMIIFPIYVLTIKKYDYLHDYFFLLLTAACIGFIFYYFFPTTGPASHFPSSYFSIDQLATGVKFDQIHHYQQPTTQSGGLIAMPSFHVIWAWLIVYLIRFKPLYCIPTAIINIFLTGACVLLGWHYYLDIVGSLIVLLISFLIYKRGIIRQHFLNKQTSFAIID